MTGQFKMYGKQFMIMGGVIVKSMMNIIEKESH